MDERPEPVPAIKDTQDSDLDELLWLSESDNDDLREQNDELRKRCYQLEQRLSVPVQTSGKDQTFRDELRKLPASPVEALDLAADIWQDRIVVLPSARRSIAEWQGDVFDAWEVITSVTCDLWQMLFEESPSDFCQEFKHRTGLDLTLREGKETRRRTDLMRLRTQTYDGKKVTGEAHVKGHGRKNGIRLHYYVDKNRRLVVVTHCGNHLRTAGTKRKGY